MSISRLFLFRFVCTVFFAVAFCLLVSQSLAQTNKVAPAAVPADSNGDAEPIPHDIKDSLEAAATAFNASRVADALDILKEVYAKHPEIVPPRMILAQWFAKANLIDAVRVNLEMATDELPDDPEAYLLLAEFALRQHSLTAAELLLNKAEEKIEKYTANPKRKEALESTFLRVSTDFCEARQRWSKMEEVVDKRIKHDGESSQLLRQKGVALFRQKKEDEAKKIFVQADNLDANTDKKGLIADAIMAQLYLAQGDNGKARQILDAALKANPNSKEIIALSIRVNINDDKLEEAKPLAEKLLKDDPLSSSAKLLLATVALYMDDYATAEKLFQDLLLDSPNDGQSQNGLALALCEQESPEKMRRALEYAIDNVRRSNNNSEFLATLGWVQYKAGQFEQAANSLKMSTSTGQIKSATAYYLARLAVRGGNTAEAKKLLEAALNGDRQFAKRREAAKLLEELSK